jgi:hypothetical protein
MALAQAFAGTAREDKCSNARPDKRETDDQRLHSEFPLSESSPTGFANPGEVNAPLKCQLSRFRRGPAHSTLPVHNTGLNLNSGTEGNFTRPCNCVVRPAASAAICVGIHVTHTGVPYPLVGTDRAKAAQ